MISAQPESGSRALDLLDHFDNYEHLAGALWCDTCGRRVDGDSRECPACEKVRREGTARN